jgi:hypothetical protein
MMHHPSLDGQSGASLQILSEHGHAIVRKESTSLQGNQRLERQMRKQQAFSQLDSPIKTPEILDAGINSAGFFYFDMRFVSGLDGHRFLEQCSPAEMRAFAEKLTTHLSLISNHPCIGNASDHASLYNSCIYKLHEVYRKNVGLSDELATKIHGVLASVRQTNIDTQAFCHGDFTLENMILGLKGELVFVDFLDSTFEHPIQDYIKLSQDIHGGWFRARGRRISGSYIAYLEKIVECAAEKTIPKYSSVKFALLSLNFCRILPYVRDPIQRKFVIDRISQFVQHSS